MPPIESGHLAAGPWEQAFFFELPGPPRSKSNARRFGRSASSASERAAYYASKAFGRACATVAEIARPSGWPLGPTGPGTLAKRPQVVSVIIARTVLDATNVPKTLHDALEGIVFHNDASVRCATQLTVRGRDGGGVAAFARLAPEASSAQVAEATAALVDQLLPHAERLVPQGLA